MNLKMLFSSSAAAIAGGSTFYHMVSHLNRGVIFHDLGMPVFVGLFAFSTFYTPENQEAEWDDGWDEQAFMANREIERKSRALHIVSKTRGGEGNYEALLDRYSPTVK